MCRTTQRRQLHSVPTLINGDAIKAHGYPDFLSPHGVRIAWTEYMEWIVQKLNRLTAGMTALLNPAASTSDLSEAGFPSTRR